MLTFAEAYNAIQSYVEVATPPVPAMQLARYTLTNTRGMEVDILPYGATVAAIRLPERGKDTKTNVVVGFDDAKDYEVQKHPHFGGIIGPVANRIADASFNLNNEAYTFKPNENTSLLHSGDAVFDDKLWRVEGYDTQSITLNYIAQDNSFPGEINTTVTYSLNNNNELSIAYNAVNEGAICSTPFVPTNHMYVNLSGGGSVENQILQMHTQQYMPTDAGIPRGYVTSTAATSLDFSQAKPLKALFDAPDGQPNALDDYYVLPENNNGLQPVAIVTDPASGRQMTVRSTEAGAQVYTPGNLESFGASENYDPSNPHPAICIETQNRVDAVHHTSDIYDIKDANGEIIGAKHFPSAILKPGERYESETIYKFDELATAR